MAGSVASKPLAENKQLLATQKDDVVSSSDIHMKELLAPCLHDEADTRVFVHLKHAVLLGFKEASIRAVDTDIVVISLFHYEELESLGLDKLYIEYGTGKSFQ